MLIFFICFSCLCVLKKVAAFGDNNCGMATYTDLTAATDRTVAEIKALMEKKAKLNHGLYNRFIF